MAKATLAAISGRDLTLAEALGVTSDSRGEVVAFVGGGGKTTAMFRLAAELASRPPQQAQTRRLPGTPRGERVLVTTTTHIFPPDSPDLPPPVLADTLTELLAKTRTAFARHTVVVVARCLNPDGRLAGIDPDWIATLHDKSRTHVLVEADGSKSRPFKAPAEHEPVIPASADLVVPVVGLSVIGQPLSDECVHRAERVAALSGLKMDDRIGAESVCRVLAHQEGGCKGVPAGARVVFLLNQADDDVRLEAGCKIARSLMASPAKPERVVIAALAPPSGVPKSDAKGPAVVQPSGIREVVISTSDFSTHMPAAPVAAVVLAAGQATRMGELKLGMRLGAKSLLRRVVESALASPIADVVVVLGHGADELRQELPASDRVRVVFNPSFAGGQSTSLMAGIQVLAPEMQAAILLLGDQPLISPEAIRALIAAFRIRPAKLIRSVYRGALASHPVLFSRRLFTELLQVTGDRGGRELLLRHQEEALTVKLDLDPPVDIDTMEDYLELAKKFSGRGGKL